MSTVEKTPPRAFHLMPLPILSAQLAPTYATATQRLPLEVMDDLRSALREGNLQAPIVEATWRALVKERPGLGEAELLEKMASAMARTEQGPALRDATERQRNRMMPLFAFIDANVGRTSDAARAVLESPEGRVMLQKGVDEAGAFLAERIIAAAKGKAAKVR